MNKFFGVLAALLVFASVVPFASAAIAQYDAFTYIEGYLGSRVPDDRVDPWTIHRSIWGAGRAVTPQNAPLVAFSGTVYNPLNGKSFFEEENLFLYAQTTYDQPSREVKSKLGRFGDSLSFTPAISPSVGVGTQIYFLGGLWKITRMVGFTRNGCENCFIDLTNVVNGEQIVLTDAAELPGSRPWTVRLEVEVMAAGSALKKIKLSDITSVPRLSAGQKVPIVLPAGGSKHSHDFVFNGLESVQRDDLNVSTGFYYFPMYAGDTETRGAAIRVSSSSPQAFFLDRPQFTSVDSAWFVVGNSGGQAQPGDVFYYNASSGYYERRRLNGQSHLNYFEYRPRQAFLSNLTFNAINAEQSGGPDLENFTMAVSEQVNDEGARGGWFFDVGDAGTYNPVLFAPGSEYLGYSGTDSSVWFEHFAYWWESGYVSWRGSVGRIYGSTEASISYALSLAHAKYSLEKLSSSIITAPSPKPTVKPTTVVKPTAAPKTKGKTGVGVAGAPPEIQNLGAPVFAAVGAALVLVALAYYWVWTKKKK